MRLPVRLVQSLLLPTYSPNGSSTPRDVSAYRWHLWGHISINDILDKVLEALVIVFNRLRWDLIEIRDFILSDLLSHFIPVGPDHCPMRRGNLWLLFIVMRWPLLLHHGPIYQVSLCLWSVMASQLMGPTVGFMGFMGTGLPFRTQRGPHVGKALGIKGSTPTWLIWGPQLAKHDHYFTWAKTMGIAYKNSVLPMCGETMVLYRQFHGPNVCPTSYQ